MNLFKPQHRYDVISDGDPNKSSFIIPNLLQNSLATSTYFPPDVDECAEEPCSHACFNTYGSYMCNCDEGFELGSDGTSCNGEWAF